MIHCLFEIYRRLLTINAREGRWNLQQKHVSWLKNKAVNTFWKHAYAKSWQ